MVRPLLSDNEFELIVKAMEDFKNNEGPVLQKILEKRFVVYKNMLIFANSNTLITVHLFVFIAPTNVSYSLETNSEQLYDTQVRYWHSISS